MNLSAKYPQVRVVILAEADANTMGRTLELEWRSWQSYVMDHPGRYRLELVGPLPDPPKEAQT